MKKPIAKRANWAAIGGWVAIVGVIIAVITLYYAIPTKTHLLRIVIAVAKNGSHDDDYRVDTNSILENLGNQPETLIYSQMFFTCADGQVIYQYAKLGPYQINAGQSQSLNSSWTFDKAQLVDCSDGRGRVSIQIQLEYNQEIFKYPIGDIGVNENHFSFCKIEKFEVSRVCGLLPNRDRKPECLYSTVPATEVCSTL